MPAKKQKQDATTEWFNSISGKSDTNILIDLITEVAQTDIRKSEFNPQLFENSLQLGVIPKKGVSENLIRDALGLNQYAVDLQISRSKREPRGTSLKLQVQSILPNNLTKKERETLTYVLSRIVTERISRDIKWPIIPKGLDTLSASLLQLYIISKAVNQKIPWMLAIWKTKIREAKIYALETIQDSLTKDRTKKEIEEILGKVNREFNNQLSLSDIDDENPFSQQITKWKSAFSMQDKDDYYIGDLEKKVRVKLSEIKEYSTSLTENPQAQSEPLTNWNVVTLRSDGPLALEYHSLLRLLRMEFNILSYEPVWNMCLNLANVEIPGRPIVADLTEVSEYSGRNAYYEMHRIEPLFKERYIPNLMKIGLRYRYIFADTQRSGVDSDGLIERLNFMEEDVRSCTVHIEPNWSRGPDLKLFSGVFTEAVVEDEIVTLNLNHYDSKSSDWSLLKKDTKSTFHLRDKLILQRSSQVENKKPFSLTQRQAEILGLIWSIQDHRRKRNWLLNAIKHRRATANRNILTLLRNGVIRLLYLPALEFCRLPDGLLTYANCRDRKSRDRLVEHIIESQPYSRIHIGDSNDVVAQIRTPFKQSDTVAGYLDDKMSEYADTHFTARIEERKTYRIPAFHTLYKPRDKEWIDPWTN